MQMAFTCDIKPSQSYFLVFFMLFNVDFFDPFQPSVAFHIETSHLTCIANEMTGFYMKCKTGLK